MENFLHLLRVIFAPLKDIFSFFMPSRHSLSQDQEAWLEFVNEHVDIISNPEPTTKDNTPIILLKTIYSQISKSGFQEVLRECKKLLLLNPKLINQEKIRKKVLKINVKKNAAKLCNTIHRLVHFIKHPDTKDKLEISASKKILNCVNQGVYRYNRVLKIYAYVKNSNRLVTILSEGIFSNKNERSFKSKGDNKYTLKQMKAAMLGVQEKYGIDTFCVRNRANTHTYLVWVKNGQFYRCDAYHKKLNGTLWGNKRHSIAPREVYYYL